MSTARLAAARRYRIRFLSAMVAYAVTILLLVPMAKGDLPLWSKMLLMLVPVVPVLVAVSEILRYVRSLDELEQRVQFEAVCVAGVLTCLATFAWGLLEIAGLPKMPVVLVLPLFCALYGGATAIGCRRFR